MTIGPFHVFVLVQNRLRCFPHLLQKTEHFCRGCQEKVAKIVHCGLARLHTALIGAYAPMLGTRSNQLSLGRFSPQQTQYARRRVRSTTGAVRIREPRTPKRAPLRLLPNVHVLTTVERQTCRLIRLDTLASSTVRAALCGRPSLKRASFETGGHRGVVAVLQRLPWRKMSAQHCSLCRYSARRPRLIDNPLDSNQWDSFRSSPPLGVTNYSILTRGETAEKSYSLGC
jgi:hypothetical protein